MATAVPAVEPAPGTIGYELEQIRLVANGGKKLSRNEFAEQIGITPSQLMGAETGKKIKEEVWEKIKTAYPHLEQFLPNHFPTGDGPKAAPTSEDVSSAATESGTLVSSSGA
ncbi:MAG TPA: hypothetical protein VHK27_08740, partial [Gammaproteobacteria bacterium]|nr:hypothetical protein [Gammaproteobacteria bacterium]